MAKNIDITFSFIAYDATSRSEAGSKENHSLHLWQVKNS